MLVHQSYIAGVKFRPGAEEVLAALPDGADFDLQPEPDNPHDPNAVRVMKSGKHIGFIPRDLAPEVGKLIAEGRYRRCVRVKGTRIEIHYEEQSI